MIILWNVAILLANTHTNGVTFKEIKGGGYRIQNLCGIGVRLVKQMVIICIVDILSVF